tara:strand:- start:7892 stop:10006 length:2115 start_codon:yes stop_codon:yes gene_type:complete
MANKRLEILKDGVYVEIEFYNGQGLQYNSVINKIGSTSDRSISHSNTFEVPSIYKNITRLGLNVFNSTQLANALNTQYKAKYYVEGKLLQQGLVMINNMDGGVISLNFVDEALSLVEKWGSTSYKELLNDDLLVANVSTSYQSAITAIKAYDMDKTNPLVRVPDVSGKTYPVVYFPNNINTIGDKFQVDADGTRSIDRFNPYQSRPIFNAKAFLDIVTQAYGYTLIENTSIDWNEMASTIITADSLTQGEKGESGSSTIVYPLIDLSNFYFAGVNSQLQSYESQVAMTFSSNAGIAPNSIANFPSQPFPRYQGGTSSLFFTTRTIFVPDVSAGNVGLIKFEANNTNPGGNISFRAVYILYKDTTSSGYITESATIETNNNTTSVIDVTINKSQFDNPTNPNAGVAVGLFLVSINQTDSYDMTDMVVTEEVLSGDIVSYDDNGQFQQDVIDLTYGAPQKSIKKIINGLLQRFGALIDINHKQNQIEIFSYLSYGTKRYANQYVDWSPYLQKYNSPNYNTEFGNRYAIKNSIGLQSPYLGNSVNRFLGNQVTNAKLKEFATDYNTEFQDITKLIAVVNSTSALSYDEFSIDGAAMVQFLSSSSDYTQRRFDNSTQGTITNIAFIENVNYSTLPSGQDEWYTLIDESLKGEPTFLLPYEQIEGLDIKLPIYVSHLGGFYIIEEVEAYEDEQTPVTVKLIKLPIQWGI